MQIIALSRPSVDTLMFKLELAKVLSSMGTVSLDFENQDLNPMMGDYLNQWQECDGIGLVSSEESDFMIKSCQSDLADHHMFILEPNTYSISHLKTVLSENIKLSALVYINAQEDAFDLDYIIKYHLSEFSIDKACLKIEIPWDDTIIKAQFQTQLSGLVHLKGQSKIKRQGLINLCQHLVEPTVKQVKTLKKLIKRR